MSAAACPSDGGGAWHSHWTGGGTDGVGVPNLCNSTADYMMENLQNLNLTYPAGLPVHDGGAINVIPGSHLFRDPDNCRGRYAGATTPGGSYYAQHHRQQQPGLPPGGHPTLPAGGAAARGLGSGGRHQPPRPTDKYAPRSTDKTDQQGVGRRAADDVGGIERWMDGKLHPITGEPLRRVEVSLPVGSLVCLNSHAAHAVRKGPRPTDTNAPRSTDSTRSPPLH